MAASALPKMQRARLEEVTGYCSNEAARRGWHADRDVLPRMAFLSRACKNMPRGIEETSMKAMMWRYRDEARPSQITSRASQRREPHYPGANRQIVSGLP